MQNAEHKIFIGRLDKADFPDLELTNINIKIDSGAYTSSIHCSTIKEIKEGNTSSLRLKFLDDTYSNFLDKEFIFTEYTSKIVKSSNGLSEKRFLIKTTILLFDIKFPIHLTVTERTGMKYPVLLGRKFLNKKFVIDTAKKNLSHKLKHKEK